MPKECRFRAFRPFTSCSSGVRGVDKKISQPELKGFQTISEATQSFTRKVRVFRSPRVGNVSVHWFTHCCQYFARTGVEWSEGAAKKPEAEVL
jgi:hypothetical protein